MTVDEMHETLPETELRDRAIRQLKKKRDFHSHLLVYLLFNAALVAIWAVTGAGGFFWPVIPIALWGIGVVMNGWEAYHSGEFAEHDIQREIRRLSSPRT